jgi:uncharacterized protein (TIGR02453 family)
MIEKSTLDFLNKLRKNNSKEWFDKNRPLYETAKGNVENFVSQVLIRMAPFEPQIGMLVAKKCLFRINRDIRFSKNKSPYKTNFGASMNSGGKKDPGAGYYIHIEPGNSFVGGGIYMPETVMLHAVRQEIDYDLKGFQKILADKKFKKIFGGLETIEKLQRPPKGYEESNPAVDLLKHKHFIVSCMLSDTDLQSKNLVKQTVAAFETMHPFIAFLNRAKGG